MIAEIYLSIGMGSNFLISFGWTLDLPILRNVTYLTVHF